MCKISQCHVAPFIKKQSQLKRKIISKKKLNNFKFRSFSKNYWRHICDMFNQKAKKK